MFREHWEHARHCENERIWFTNIYAIVVAAILVFIGDAVLDGSSDYGSVILLTLFGLILSIIGFLIVVALTLGYLHHITDIVMIYYYSDNMEFYRHPGKPARFGAAHRRFFEITIALFGVLAILCTLQDTVLPEDFSSSKYWALRASLWIIIFVAIEAWYQCNWKKHSTHCVRFMKALQRDLKREYRREWFCWFVHPTSGGLPIRDFEVIQQRVVEDAERRGIIDPRKECWLAGKLCWIFRGPGRIYEKIHYYLCEKYRKSDAGLDTGRDTGQDCC